MQHKLAVQLYTLREELKRDFPQVLKELKDMGWRAVQLSGFNGYDPNQVHVLSKHAPITN